MIISVNAIRALFLPFHMERYLTPVTLGQVPVGSSPDEFARFVKSEGAKWLKLIKQANIQPG